MIDLHNHTLYGIDDGATDFEVACDMLTRASREGFKKIALTSHYNPEVYRYTSEDYDQTFKKLKSWIKEQGISLSLFSGNEILLTKNTYLDIQEKKCRPYGDTHAYLIEVSDYMNLHETDSLLRQLDSLGICIVLAHVERMRWVSEHFDMLREWYERGYIFQVNASSLEKKRLRHNKSTRVLLKNRMIHIVSTDAHNADKRPPIVRETCDFLTKRYGEGVAEMLLEVNPSRILNKQKPFDWNDFDDSPKSFFRRWLS